MSELLTIDRQRRLLRELAKLAAARYAEETRIAAAYKSAVEKTQREFDLLRRQTVDEFAAKRTAFQNDYERAVGEAQKKSAAELEALDEEYRQILDAAEVDYASKSTQATTDLKDSRWQSSTIYQEARKSLNAGFRVVDDELRESAERIERLDERLERFLSERSLHEVLKADPRPTVLGDDRADAYRAIQDSTGSAEQFLDRLESLSALSALKNERLEWTSAAVGVLSIYPFVFVLGRFLIGLGAGVAFGLAFFLFAKWMARSAARRQASPIFASLAQALADARSHSTQCRKLASASYEQQRSELKAKRDGEYQAAEAEYSRRQDKSKIEHDRAIATAKSAFPERRKQAENRWKETIRSAQESHPKEKEALEQQEAAALSAVDSKRAGATADADSRRDADWAKMAGDWRAGLEKFADAVRRMNEERERIYPSDPATLVQSWTPPTELPAAVCFGEFDVELARIPHGLPTDRRLMEGLPAKFALPALLPFPSGIRVLLKVDEKSRAESDRFLQLVMLHLLMAVPPGKIRFLIFDPVGLGRSFAAFMHLADHDEQLVSARIWTESSAIEQRLTDLTEHMENVLQKYLRNEYDTIEAYNEKAGEVAEPFRVLVTANFPVQFTESAARRLVSVQNSGARCGVLTLVSVDSGQGAPHGFRMADLEHDTIQLVWSGQGFAWNDPDFGRFPLRLDPLPPSEAVTQLLDRIGKLAKDSLRVEVPFEFIAPKLEERQKGDSRDGIDVKLGRVGATKRQHLKLGQGTSQHVLIAGKTGSGKSTLLHALITNLALTYSPDEIALYLIDFKKGVEFKTYATHGLPHAKVIAIESEREFGLSVLERLDEELRIRGDRFRDLGAQNLAAARDADKINPIPRIMLIVDEFQEFFIEDDKVAQGAALLLDRLVRQGRAFGIHVLLGSQTLGGAYTLARSTLGQMAVRIALQCSEADAHMILSEDNSAARLLSRPGEAIYNDANGLVEGNHPFQVVWLSDETRDRYLQEIAANSKGTASEPLIFEGSVPAELRKNRLLANLLDGAVEDQRRPVSAWMGEAIAIKDPTCATFRPQSGKNLLIVGQREETALALASSALISLAFQNRDVKDPEPTDGSDDWRIIVLDATPSDAAEAGYFGDLVDRLPGPITVAGPRQVAEQIARVAVELENRQKTGQPGPPRFLFVHGLHRFRDLRKPEDDFGFSRGEAKTVSPGKQFAAILRDGAAMGIHVVVWCDSYTNLQRAMDRQVLREFELRVLLQMSGSDSSSLVDSPAASKLGLYRALFVSEEENRLEKFRPYGLPSLDWVQAQTDRWDSHSPRQPDQLPAT